MNQPPICVRTFGRFEILRGGGRLERVQARPADLLKAIIALGPEGVSLTHLGAALWPDQDGDAAQSVLEITLHRLRRQLGDAGAILVRSGRISVDSSTCWVDAVEFESAPNDCVRCVQACAEGCRRRLLLYTGHFLASEGEYPWMLAARERYRSRFVRCVECLARCDPCSTDAHEAVALYRFAIERDPANEAFHCGLTRALAQIGRRGEALLAYERLARLLRLSLGVDPSLESRALHAALAPFGSTHGRDAGVPISTAH